MPLPESLLWVHRLCWTQSTQLVLFPGASLPRPEIPIPSLPCKILFNKWFTPWTWKNVHIYSAMVREGLSANTKLSCTK